jgi:hypothetical protein
LQHRECAKFLGVGREHWKRPFAEKIHTYIYSVLQIYSLIKITGVVNDKQIIPLLGKPHKGCYLRNRNDEECPSCRRQFRDD